MSVVFAMACAKAEKTLNTALSYDPNAKNIFADIAGKSLRISCHLPPVNIIISCTTSEIFVQPASDSDVDDTVVDDAQLIGSAPALILLAMESLPISDPEATDDSKVTNDDAKLSDAQAYDGPVLISGDTAFIMALRERLQNLNVDWEAWLATFIGDIPTHLAAKSARNAHQWQSQTRARAADSFENYFQNEWSSAPFQKPVHQFTETLVTLGSDRERVKQRLNSLKSQFLRFMG